jgi:hypothetical protein
LNVSDFGLIEEGAMRRVRNQTTRIFVVLATMVAWFSISSHCAFSTLVAAKTQSAIPQMHCHGSPPAPAKRSGEEEMPCCKVLCATLASQGKIIQIASKDFLPVQSWIVTEKIFADEAQLHRAPQELDTGPPGENSFVQSVLQRSILVHAPPLSLS